MFCDDDQSIPTGHLQHQESWPGESYLVDGFIMGFGRATGDCSGGVCQWGLAAAAAGLPYFG